MRVQPAGSVIEASVTAVPPRNAKYASMTSLASVPAGLFAVIEFAVPEVPAVADARRVIGDAPLVPDAAGALSRYRFVSTVPAFIVWFADI